jgi:hypothetical protein
MPKRYVILRNIYTGEFVYIDTFERRYQRMVNKLRLWEDLAKEYYPSCHIVPITLTYARKGKNCFDRGDIREFVRNARSKNIYGYTWVLENHADGYPHYHIGFLTELTEVKIQWDKGRIWVSPIVPIIVNYHIEHVLKKYQKNYELFPHGARCFGSRLEGIDKLFRYLYNKGDCEYEFMNAGGMGTISNYINTEDQNANKI